MLYYMFYFYVYSVPPIPSPTSSIVDNTNSTTATISFNNTITSSNPSASNKMTAFSSIVSDATNKITESVINSSVVNAGGASEHENIKSTNIPVILALVFSGLLGLSIVMCIVGLLLRKQKKKTHIKKHKFIAAASNPLFQR